MKIKLNKDINGNILYPIIVAGSYTREQSFSSNEEAIEWAQNNISSNIVWEIHYTRRAPHNTPAKRNQSIMNQIWEYKVIHLNSREGYQILELKLNSLGQQGWDLISTQDQYLVLKRKTLSVSLTDPDPQPIEIREEI